MCRCFLLPLVLGLGMFLCGGGTGLPQADAQQPRRPHIIHIIADDLGWRDMGYQGSPDIKTPHIDRLAAAGVKFQQFYTSPMCTPTRAAVLTGRYPFRYGLQSFVIPAALKYGLPTDEWLLPQALQAAGYWTAILGKWHLGHADRKFWPQQRGFDHQYGYLTSELDYFEHTVRGVPDWWRNGEPVQEEGYSTTLLGNEAVTLINEHDLDKPLYMYLAFNAPHSPYQATEDYLKQYAEIEDETRRTYAAMVTAMDDQIGRVVAALDKRKMRDNTLIVFHSDNGGLRDAGVAGERPAKPVADNGPLRGGKGDTYEGGTRVAAFANWPGVIEGGRKANQLLHVVDLYPTFLSLAGGQRDRGKPLDGMDVWGVISEDKPSPRKEIVYNIEPAGGAIRQGDWKIVWEVSLLPRVELFNLADDPYEKNNLAGANPDKVAALRERVAELGAEMTRPLFTEATRELIFLLPPALPTAKQ